MIILDIPIMFKLIIDKSKGDALSIPNKKHMSKQ